MRQEIRPLTSPLQNPTRTPAVNRRAREALVAPRTTVRPATMAAATMLNGSRPEGVIINRGDEEVNDHDLDCLRDTEQEAGRGPQPQRCRGAFTPGACPAQRGSPADTEQDEKRRDPARGVLDRRVAVAGVADQDRNDEQRGEGEPREQTEPRQAMVSNYTRQLHSVLSRRCRTAWS
ncbi:MAG: hypothetical protein H0X71_08450 [Rubrobacter sp.]|nr:hypothetical protein [Rubrobacter sp.]